MKPSTFLTAGEASRATGKSIPTITRNVKNGKIANSRQGDDGEYEIDPSALFNRYPAIDSALGGKSNDTPNKLVSETPRLDPSLQAIIDANKQTIEQLEARIEEKDELLDDYKTRLRETKKLTDERTEEAKAAAAALAQTKIDIELTPKPKKRRVSFWDVLKNGGAIEVNEVEEVA